MTLPTSAWDGRNAEWINERPSYGGSNPYLPLTNYGVQHWANGSACPSTATGSPLLHHRPIQFDLHRNDR